MTNQEKKKVAFVGSPMYHDALLIYSKRDHNFDLSEFRFADEGLVRLLREKFDLIIMRDEIASGMLKLPEGLSLNDYSGIVCYLIEQVRGTKNPNNDTPIIVPISLDDSLTSAERYQQAGASECVNVNQRDTLKIFSRVVGKHLTRYTLLSPLGVPRKV